MSLILCRRQRNARIFFKIEADEKKYRRHNLIFRDNFLSKVNKCPIFFSSNKEIGKNNHFWTGTTGGLAGCSSFNDFGGYHGSQGKRRSTRRGPG